MRFAPAMISAAAKLAFWIAGGGLVAALLIVSVMMTLKASSTDSSGDVPAFETPAWQAADGALLMRREAAGGGGTLLLKHSTRGAVYKYDPAKQSLTLVAEDEWRSAGGPVADCSEQVPARPSVLRIDPKSNKLLAGDLEVRTAGRTVLTMRASPSQKWVAVLSADGPKRGSILPFLASGGASGQHYHEVFSLADIAPRGNPARLKAGGEKEILTPCWSPEERMVVYADLFFFSLSFVETEPSTDQSPTEVSK